MTRSPRISVILPTHNRVALLRRSLASVLGQTFADLEVLVVDNAATDGTADFLAGLSDPRVRVIRLRQLCGASAARNAALREVRSPLVAFQDDDDIWLPDKLERQVAALEAAGAEAGLCLCGYLRLVPDGVECRYERRFFDEIDFSMGVLLRNFSVVATPGWLVRKEYLDQAGYFDEALPARNDWELALRLFDICRFTYVEGPLFIQDQTRPTTMHRNEAAFSVALRRLIAMHGHRWRKPRVVASHAALIGRHELTVGNRAEGRRWLRTALAANFCQPRVLLLYASSYFGTGFVGWMRRLSQKLSTGKYR